VLCPSLINVTLTSPVFTESDGEELFPPMTLNDVPSTSTFIRSVSIVKGRFLFLLISKNASPFNRTSLSDSVDSFLDKDFWEDYNIIEPDESLESAVNRLKKEEKK